jgi:hypothetical protein
MTLVRILMGALLVWSPFQDTFLRNTPLRMLGTSFAVIPLFGLVMLDGARWLAAREKRVNWKMAAAGAYCAAVTLIHLAAFGVEWHGVDLVVKTFNLALMFALAAYVVFRLDWYGFPHLRLCAHAAFAICTAGILIHDLNLFGMRGLLANPLFHATDNPDTRWHGLCPEASVLSLSTGSLGLLSAACARRWWTRAALLGITAVLLAGSGSKGAVLALALVSAAVGLFARGYRLRVALGCLLLLPAGYLGYIRLQQMASADAIHQSTTMATRGSLFFWAAEVVAHHPLGVGFGGFYHALTRYLPGAMDRMYQTSPLPLDFEEVQGYLSSAQYAGTKTLVFDLAVYFGISFLVAFGWFVTRLWRACQAMRKPMLLIAIVFVAAGFSTYGGSPARYDTLVVLGVGWSLYRRWREGGAGGAPIDR